MGAEAVPGGKTCVRFSWRKIRSLVDQFHYCIEYVQTVSALVGKWKFAVTLPVVAVSCTELALLWQ